MIEFKAECGHIIRAKDSQAGNVVRCAYCGQPVQIPVMDLSVLATEIPPPPEHEPPRRWRLFGRKRRRGTERSGGLRLFPIILRLMYVAALVVVLVVLGQRFVLPMLDPDARAQRFAGGVPTRPASDRASVSTEPADRGNGSDLTAAVGRPEAGALPGEARPEPAGSADEARFKPATAGLVGVDVTEGVYVASTPPGAEVFCLNEADAPSSGRIHDLPGTIRFEAGSRMRTTVAGDGLNTPGEAPLVQAVPAIRLLDGSYVIEVVFAWNDPRLSDSSLSGYEDYVRFRRAVERASASERTRLVNEFFLPDEAKAVFIDETPDQFYLVRQYRPVTVRQGRSKGVRALFLPRFATGEGGRFSVDRLLHGYIPDVGRYNFDPDHVRSELSYYSVPDEDQPALIEALSRIGQIPYATPDGRIHLFKIGIHDGVFAARVLRLADP